MRPENNLAALAAIFWLSSGVISALAGESLDEWLDRAADPVLSRREREFASRQVLMLADDSASIIVSALAERDPGKRLRRQAAARLLGELALPEAEAPLIEAFFAEDPILSETAGAALAKLYSRLDPANLSRLLSQDKPIAAGFPPPPGSGLDDWLSLSLAGSGSTERFRAVVMRAIAVKYARTGGLDQRLLPQVLACLSNGGTELRIWSVQAAALSGEAAAAEKIVTLLYYETHPGLLIQALRFLAESRLAAYLPAAERQAAHADPLVAIEALAALAALGYGGAVFPPGPGARSIAGYIHHPSTPVRRRAIELLGLSRNPAAIEYLEAALFDRVGANRAAAVRALAKIGFAGLAGSLSPLLRDGRPEVRTEAAIALAGMGVVGVTARVLEDLAGESPPFRRAAARSLGAMGDARAIPALLEALEDQDLELACLAAESLGEMAGKELGANLFARLVSRGNPVLADAIRLALRKIYQDDPGDSPGAWGSWARRNRLSGGSP
ncbi:MAG: HEAT repeat domain-containing protein [Planctomycetota bacterium]|jgi:HEAT repeat protein|nr:HEAT repeat domain-containing protein [Planctomycetota bacterium]MDR1520119.1 HEAT repeat domain-containing protein [Planctomycetota bacterium]